MKNFGDIKKQGATMKIKKKKIDKSDCLCILQMDISLQSIGHD
jgi:hypothetical protein